MMERYREYKESGVKWLGEIPSHWEVVRGLGVFSENKSKNTQLENSTVLSLSYGKIIVKKDIDSGLVPEEYSSYQIVRPGCIIVRSTDLQNDKTSLRIGYVCDEGIITSAYLGLQVKGNNNDKYLYYFLHDWDITKEIYRHGNGLRQSLSWNDLRDNSVLLPPLSEQDAIVRYLDTATSEIDKAIAMQQKMIDLLNERKQIIIQNAVTKGLDENVEMKESGVESIGRIPIGWKIKKLKYVMRSFGRIGFRGYGTKDIVDEGQGAITLSPSNIQESSMDYSKRTYLSWNKYYESPEIMIENGDVLMVKTGSSYGKCAIVKNMPMECTINPQLVVFKEHTEMPEYLAYCFQASFAKFFINTSVIGGTIPTISQEKINNYVFPFPMKSEQQQIVTYLDSEMQRFDSAISNCQRQITLLQERKQIIINEVVTGKVRVI